MAETDNENLLSEIESYYDEKLSLHGDSPRGVDWNGEESQLLRFRQLCRIIDTGEAFSLNDFGCGYGALVDFLDREYENYSYTGIDLSERMVAAARQRHGANAAVRFVQAGQPDRIADYTVASGVFNVRLEQSDEAWRAYLESTLDLLDRYSRLGFSFNCLTAYSDADRMRDYLYYADPCELFDLCKRRYSRNVALLHDYGLYEFTLLVRKIP